MGNLSATTNYVGTVLEELYSVLEVGNDVIAKGACRVLTGVDGNKYLPKISTADNPLAAYSSTPTETATTTYAERTLAVDTMMLYEEFNPRTSFGSIWPVFRAQGPDSNLLMNPTVMAAMMQVYGNKVGQHLARLAFQGDEDSVTAALALTDGWVLLASEDASVVDVANVGEITTANVASILRKVWNAIPNQFLDDPSYRIMMSTTDWKKLQNYNNEVKASYRGVLDEAVGNLINNKRIEHFNGMAEHTIMAAKGTPGIDSNLFMGVWFDPDAEPPRVMRTANNEEDWFIRMNFRVGFQYREGSEIVLYQGS